MMKKVLLSSLFCTLIFTGMFAQGGEDCSSATTISSLPYTDTGNTSSAADDYDEVCPFNNPGAPDLVYKYTPAQNISADFTLCTGITNYDSKMYIYENTCPFLGLGGNLVGCNDDACANPPFFTNNFVSEIIGLPMTAGSTYYIVIDGFAAASVGDYTLDITPILKNDLSITSIVTPIDGCPNAAEAVEVVITNFGDTTVSTADMTLTVDGGTTIQETFTGTIPPFGTANYTFTATADLSTIGNHTVVVSATGPNDPVNANDTLSVSIDKLTVTSYPYVETFDNFILCDQCADGACAFAGGWVNAQGDSFDDWDVGTGATPNFNTGPSGDVSGSGNYIFTNAFFCNFNSVIAISPCFDLASLSAPGVTFDYHMWGPDIGTMTLEIDSMGTWVPLWTRTGDQGNQWREAFASLANYAGQTVQFRIVGQTIGGFQGDMAFDEFTVKDFPPDAGALSLVTPINGCLTNNETVTVEVFNFGTAPIDTIELSLWADGSFVATETMITNIAGAASANYTFSTPVNVGGFGNHTIQVSANLQDGNGDPDASNDTLNVTLENTLVSTYPYVENFDNFTQCINCTDGGCSNAFTSFGWVNVIGDGNDDWDVNSGSTTSGNTGPTGDHTSGSGNYLYTETSGCNNNTVFAETPCFDFTTLPNPEVSFWYHMFGAAIGTLSFEMDTGTGTWVQLWTQTGNQGNSWQEVVIDLAPYANNLIKFRFNALTGNTFTSDISIDDFAIRTNVPDNTGASALVAPGDDCGLSATEIVTVTVENYGPTVTDTVEMTMWIDGVFSATETWIQTIPADTSADYTFTATADLSVPGSHTIQVSASRLGIDNYPADDTATFTVNNTIINTFPYTENFDSWTNCIACADGACADDVLTPGWANASGDTDDWDINSGSTTSGNTGPNADHTTGNGNYLYTETSGCNNNNVFLETPCFDINSLPLPGISFWYHMQGATMGTLDLEIDNGSGWTSIWTQVGDPGVGDLWQEAIVDLTPFVNGNIIQMRFNGQTGTSFTSDMAIDDINVRSFGNDAGPLALITPEDGCQLSATETVTAEIRNFGLNPIDTFALQLIVDGTLLSTDTLIQTVAGLATTTYTFPATADLSVVGPHDVTVIARAFSGDVSLNTDTLNTVVTKSVINTYPYSENFDSWANCFDFCTDGNCAGAVNTIGWEQGTGDDDDWDILTGATGSFGTGPSGDHTGGGNYIYTETSGCNNTDAYMTSPCFDLTPLSNPVIRFWYHMWGGDMGTLNLQVDAGAGWTTIWSLSGDQGNAWQQGKAALGAYAGQTVQFRFWAETGSGLQSDMAVDDILIEENTDNDVSVTALVSPSPLGTCQGTGANEFITVEVTNQGVFAIDSVNLTLDVDGNTIVTDISTVVIPVGGSILHTFSVPVDMSAITTFNIVSTVAMDNDSDPGNDVLVSNFLNEGAPIDVFPYVQNFDAYSTCFGFCFDGSCPLPIAGRWTNPLGEGDDWEVLSGSTGSFGTGPTNDHTSGGGNYIYTEGSGCNNNEAFLETPCFDLSGLSGTGVPTLDFWYHMWGGDMGSMYLLADSSGAGQWDTLWTLAGDQGNNWIEEVIDLTAYTGKVVKFRYVGNLGNGLQSDMAIDDFRIYEKFNFDITPTAVIQPANACSFTSTETVEVEVTNLGVQAAVDPTMTLWVDGVFVASESWTNTIAPNTSANYTFTATADLSGAGGHDIQIATFFTNEENMSNDTTVFAVGPIDDYPFDENFDGFSNCTSFCQDGSCAAATVNDWVNVTGGNDNTDWSINAGATGTFGTGPSGDHTTGTGKYLFMEASGCSNSTATLESHCYDISSLTAPTASFWYHMWGDDMGTLSFQVDDGTGSWTTLWSLSGDQGNEWKQAFVSLSSFAGQVVYFRFVGTTGNGLSSDIAIDDFNLNEAPPVEIAPIGMIAPQLGCAPLSNSEPVTIEIINNGTDTAFNIITQINLMGQIVGLDTIPGPVLAGQTITHTFTNPVDFSPYNVFAMIISATAAGDPVPSNNDLTIVGENDPNAALISTFPYTEDFNGWNTCISPCQDGSCAGAGFITSPGWKNATFDDSDWSISAGPTANLNTGPSQDHTAGAGGNFIYTDGGNFCGSSEMIIETPCFDFTNLFAPRVSFWYHMFGQDVGTISLQIDSTGAGQWNTEWTLSGGQLNQWELVELDVWEYAGNIVKMRFVGTTGNAFFDPETDMGIDDFNIIDILPDDLATTEVMGPVNGCGELEQYVDVTITNVGSNVQNDYTITCDMIGLNALTLDTVMTDPVQPGQSITVTLGPFNTSQGGIYTFNSFVDLNSSPDFDINNDTISVEIMTAALSFVSGIDGEVCQEGAVTLGATGVTTEYFWYNDEFGGNFIGSGLTFTTPVLTETDTFWVEGRNPVTDFTGLLDTAQGVSAGYNDFYDDGLRFNAIFDITLEELTLYPRLKSPGTPATIRIEIKDANGDVIDNGNAVWTYTYYGTSGDTTVALNVDIPQGNGYEISTTGSANVEYYRHKGGVAYPMTIPGGIAITGPINNLGGFYYNFYNLKVTFLGCPGPRELAIATVNASTLTFGDPSQVSTSTNTSADGQATVNPAGGTTPYTFLWDNGETTQTATQLTCGFHICTVTDAAGCSSQDTVRVGCTVGTEFLESIQNLEVYPNPTTDNVTVDLALDKAREVRFEVFNVLGQKIYETSPETVPAKQLTIDFADKPGGVYQLRVTIDEESITRSIVVTDK